jgi:predicted transcriptional regulator
MEKPDKTILHVLFPEVRAQLLRTLFSLPPKKRYVRELARTSELSVHTVQDELRKLSVVGLLTSFSNGYHRFYRANPQHPLHTQLIQIVRASEKLPLTKSSALNRPPRKRPKNRRVRKPVRQRSDRLLDWHLFSRHR